MGTNRDGCMVPALHPSKDHYRCNKFYVLETRVYRTSGSAEYYPQHCSNPNFLPAEHIKELKEEVTDTIRDAERTPSNKKLMRALKGKISNFLDGKVQRVDTEGDHNGELLPTSEELTPEPSFQRVTEAPKVTTSTNPTAPRVLKTNKRTHRRKP